MSGSGRRNARKAPLRKQSDQWGEDFSAHGRSLTAGYKFNAAKDYERYTGRKTTHKHQQDELSVTFYEMYRNEQISIGQTRPILMYGAGHILLLVRACSDHSVYRKPSFTSLLQSHGKHIDYMYYVASLCHYIPWYMCKQRAVSTIRLYLLQHQFSLAPRYTLKVQSSYTSSQVKAWAKSGIKTTDYFGLIGYDTRCSECSGI